MKVVLVSTEAIPFCKKGGLADVVGEIFENLSTKLDIILALPYYNKIINIPDITDTGLILKLKMGNKKFDFSIFKKKNVYFFASDKLFSRDGIYGDKTGDFEDNAIRFAFFSKAVLECFKKLQIKIDLFHLNDWHTSLIPLYLKIHYKENSYYKNTSTVLTIHNAGYQGIFSKFLLKDIGIPSELFNPEGVEFYDKINFLKAGIIFSDILTTVSKKYANELMMPGYGYGLEGVFRNRKNDLYGILNGINYKKWSPENDPFICAKYSVNNLKGKFLCKKELVQDSAIYKPLISYIGRLDKEQKGVELIIKVFHKLIEYGCSIMILGEGDPEIEESLKKIKKQGSSYFFKIGFDETFAHKLYAGSDIIMIPSKYEPCGIVQMIALKYGTIPVARNTGGLSDTIVDYNPFSNKGTGFLFDDYNVSAFFEALKRALAIFTIKKRWYNIIKSAMKSNFSWNKSIQQYLMIYKKALDKNKLEQ